MTERSVSTHFAVFEDRERGLVLLKRSSVPVASPEEVRSMFGWVLDAVSALPSSYGCVIDVREVKGTSNPEVEKATHAPLLKLRARFARNVTLVSSAVGALHVRRLQRDRDQDSPVTSDEQEALAYAAGELKL